MEQGGGISLFKREIFEGPFYICDVRNRCLYESSFIHLSLETVPFHQKYLQICYPMMEDHTSVLHATKDY